MGPARLGPPVNDGIPFVQIEANLELDARVQLVSRKVDVEAYYAAFGVFISIILATATRGARALPSVAAQLYPAHLTEALRSVGLLDDDLSLSAPEFDQYVGWVQETQRETRAELSRRGKVGGRKRARDAKRDEAGRMLSSVDIEPADPPEGRPAQTKARPSLGPARQEGDQIKGEGSSSFADAQDEAPPERTQADWLAFVLDPDAVPRTVIKDGSPRVLGRHAEKIARIGDYYTARTGHALRDGNGGRIAKLLSDHPAKERGLLEDIGALGFDDPKGDPLDYLTATINRRQNHGTHRGPSRASRPGVDLDALAGAGLGH
jgi:hypothetical protein